MSRAAIDATKSPDTEASATSNASGPAVLAPRVVRRNFRHASGGKTPHPDTSTRATAAIPRSREAAHVAENRWLLRRPNAEVSTKRRSRLRAGREKGSEGRRMRALRGLRRPLGGTVVRRARGRENLYLVHVAAQEVARRERRGSGTKQGAASDPTTRTPDCTKGTSSSALASLRDFSNAARRRRRRAPMRPVEVIWPTSCG